MKEQIFLLIKLQNADSEIEGIKSRKRDLPEQKEALADKLKIFEDAVEEGTKRLDDSNKTHRERESHLKNGTENVKKTKSKLLEVKTNKEYEATLKEIDSINMKNSQIEDEIIYILDDIENTRKNLKIKESELADYRTIYDRKTEKIETELNSIDSVLDKMMKKYDKIREKVNLSLLKKYDILKERRNGYAVAPVWKEVCEGCHMNIPPQMYNELQKPEKLILCPNCNRIIYWESREISDEQEDI